MKYTGTDTGSVPITSDKIKFTRELCMDGLKSWGGIDKDGHLFQVECK